MVCLRLKQVYLVDIKSIWGPLNVDFLAGTKAAVAGQWQDCCAAVSDRLYPLVVDSNNIVSFLV